MALLLNEDRLLRRAATGDERAFAEIFDRYQEPLYRFCVSIVGDPQDAQDALQNTMVKVLRALPGEEREIDLKPWLYRIAHNESVELLRRRRPTAELDPELAGVGAGLAEEAEQRQRLTRLIADLGQLPERQRGALVMRELGDLGFDEIGAALGTSAATARQTVYEARLGLREMEAGREMSCLAVSKAISDGDGRVLRRRDIRAHLRGCEDCRRFRDAIGVREREFAALLPLPAVAVAAMLKGLLGGNGAGATATAAGATTAGGTGAGLGGAAAAKSIAASTVLKGIATVAVVTAVGVTAADRGGFSAADPGGGAGSVRQAPASSTSPGSGPTAGASAGSGKASTPARGTVGGGSAAARAGAAAEPGATGAGHEYGSATPGTPATHAVPGSSPDTAPTASSPKLPAASSHGQETAASHDQHGQETAAGHGETGQETAGSRNETGREVSAGAKQGSPSPPIPAGNPAQPSPPPRPEPPAAAGGSGASAAEPPPAAEKGQGKAAEAHGPPGKP